MFDERVARILSAISNCLCKLQAISKATLCDFTAT